MINTCSKCKRNLEENYPYKRCAHCRAIVTRKSYKQYDKIRTAVFDMYGGKCVCCGESTYFFLCLDHIKDDGFEDRRKRGDDGVGMYRDILKNGYRDDLQLFCSNCNMGKLRNKGQCPHKGIIDREALIFVPDLEPKLPKPKSTICLLCGESRSEAAGNSARCYKHRYTRLDGGSYNTDKPSKQKGTINIEEVHEK